MRVQLFATCLGDLVLPDAVADAEALLREARATRSSSRRRRSAAASPPSTRATVAPPPASRGRSCGRSRASCPSSSPRARARRCSRTTCRSCSESSRTRCGSCLRSSPGRRCRGGTTAARSPTTTPATCSASSGSRISRGALLEASGATLVPLRRPDLCCGFGGTFSVRQPEISVAMADDKLAGAALRRRGARHRRPGLPRAPARPRRARGRAARRPPRDRARARDRRVSALAQPPGAFRAGARRKLADARMQAALDLDRCASTTTGRGLGRPRRRRGAARARAADPRADDRRARRPPRGLRRRGRGPRRQRLLRADGGGGARVRRGRLHAGTARSSRSSRSRWLSEEIGLNAALEAAGVAGGRDRPRRVHPPARRRAPGAHRRARDREDEGGLRRAALPREGEAGRAGARGAHRRGPPPAARGVPRPPTSASPARTSASPRRARSVLVTNEGNGRLVSSLPRVHIALMGMERVVADDSPSSPSCSSSWPAAAPASRSPSTRRCSAGPRREGEEDGPGGAPRRHPRQRADEPSARPLPGDALVHPLRRLPQRLPGLPEDRRRRVLARLLGPDGRRARAAARRPRAGARPAARLVALRRLHRRVPRQDPAPRAAARPPARSRRGGVASRRERLAFTLWSLAWSPPWATG